MSGPIVLGLTHNKVLAVLQQGLEGEEKTKCTNQSLPTEEEDVERISITVCVSGREFGKAETKPMPVQS